MKEKKKDIFSPRENPKPEEYELVKYVDAIHQSFWKPSDFRFDKDIMDFKVNTTELEKDVIKKCMLSIGVVENKVKTFWARIDLRLPKPEIADVGHTFAGNEVIHKLTYEKLLNLLGLDEEFDKIDTVPCMKGRTDYLTKYLKGVKSRSNKEFTKSLILFTLLVENASLFSQFLIISSFKKHRNVMDNFSAIVTSTSKEETLHATFGCELIKIIRQENPEWFDQDMEDKIRRNIRKAYKAEEGVLEWIFEKGELDFLTKAEVKEYLKSRFNKSLEMIGYTPEFELNNQLLENTIYFDMMSQSSISFDFFDTTSSEYSVKNKVTDEDWDF